MDLHVSTNVYTNSYCLKLPIDTQSYKAALSRFDAGSNILESNTHRVLSSVSTVLSHTDDRGTISLHSPGSLTTDASSISTYTERKGGRLPGLLSYSTVNHNDKHYIVFFIRHKSNDIKFVIDEADFYKVYNHPWHLSSGKYIATTELQPDGTQKEIYLHNLLKQDELTDSVQQHVIHINHNPFDNRSENLRIVSHEEYYMSKSKRKRTITLPPDCGFASDDIPKYITYMKATGEHGDRFVIEIPKLNLVRKLTSSKKKSLKEKLDEAIEVLTAIYKEYPYINPSIDNTLKESLEASYNQILDKATF